MNGKKINHFCFLLKAPVHPDPDKQKHEKWMQTKPLLTTVRATNSNNNRLYNSSADNTVLTCLSHNWPMWHFVLTPLLVTLAATLCHFCSFMEHLFFFIIPVQLNVFLPCVFPSAAVTTVGINKVSCLVRKKKGCQSLIWIQVK